MSRALRSALSQTYQDFELLVVDDASTDNTAEVVATFAQQDPRVRYIRLETNSGGAARPKNAALAEAKGEYVAVLDADDEWLPEKLEKQLALLESNPRLGFVGCNAVVIDEQGHESKFRLPRHEHVAERILETDYMGSGSGMMYKRDVFVDVGGFDENLKSAQDWDMRIRLTGRYDFDFVDGEPLTKYYLHGDSVSGRPVEKKQADLDYIENKYRLLYRSRPRVFSNKLRYDGTRFMIAGRRARAWTAFLKSLRYNPLNLKTYLYFFLSLFGQKTYLRLARAKQTLRSRDI